MCKKHTQKLFLILADVPFKIDRLKKNDPRSEYLTMYMNSGHVRFVD